MTGSAVKKNGQRAKWFPLVWLIPVALVLLTAAVLLAQWLRTLPDVQDFVTTYPGPVQPSVGTPEGFPDWLRWSHFFNMLLILMIIRSGWYVRTTQRPPAYWTRNNQGPIRTKGKPNKVSLDLWLHLSLNVLWVGTGLTFYVLLFATGQWQRLVPVSWEHVPNALSAVLQYVSLDWPLEDGWVSYNSLQMITYFATVFIAAPLSIITGIRMSGAWPKDAKINQVYRVELARAIHFPVMLYFVLFIVGHVTLVFATGALRNLNHIFAGRNDDSWIGFWFFAGAMVLMAVLWVAARPIILRPIAALMGSVTKN